MPSSMPDVLDIRATSRILPVVPMFHVNAWGMPYAAALAGAALILPGRHLDGASMANILNDGACHVHLRRADGLARACCSTCAPAAQRLETVKRIMTGGSAAPPLLIEAFRDEYGVAVEHGWGMTEISPVGTYNAPKPAQAGLTKDEAARHMLKQGRILPGIDMKIVDGEGKELPWDGVAFGDLKVRGPWVASAYFGDEAGQRAGPGRLVRHRRRRDDRSGRVHGDHRPVEGRDQVGRRVDQLDHAGKHRRLASRRGRGGGDRRAHTRNGTSVRCCWWCRGPGSTVDPASVLALLRGQGREMVAAG